MSHLRRARRPETGGPRPARPERDPDATREEMDL